MLQQEGQSEACALGESYDSFKGSFFGNYSLNEFLGFCNRARGYTLVEGKVGSGKDIG